MAINWFPGHMHKAQKEIKEILHLIDVVIEVCDARIPFSSENPMITAIRGDKPVIKILNKCDLADPQLTKQWLDYFASQHQVNAIALDEHKTQVIDELVSKIRALVPEKNEPGKQINAMIMGIPNVGKSTLINALVGKIKAKVGNEPAVTKAQQRLKLADDLYLYDTPGMLWPKIENEHSGYRLAITSAIKDTAFEHDDIAFFAAEYLLKHYPQKLQQRYDYASESPSEIDFIEYMGAKRGCVRKGGIVDLHKASEILINEIRDNTLGGITFETPEMVEQENQYFAELAEQKRLAKAAKKAARGRGRKNKRK